MENLRVQLITWNVSCASPIDTTVMSKLVDIDGSVGIYVMSLQEIETGVLETAMSYFFYDNWAINMISLFAETNYYLIESIRLQGMSLSVFAHVSHLPHIHFIRTDLKRTGFGGYWGNKGGIAVSCNVYGKRICFLNVHLAAHIRNDPVRIQNFDAVVKCMDFGGDATLLSHDVVFLAGDLNFRIEGLPKKSIQSLISRNNLKSLLQFDRLLMHMNTHDILRQFVEDEITFPPTYKFDVGSDAYDTTYTQRLPAWTDRIMYRTNPVMKSLSKALRTTQTSLSGSTTWWNDDDDEEVRILGGSYRSLVDFKQSDHRPVVALYDLKISKDFDPLIDLDVESTWRNEESWIVRVKFDKNYVSDGGDYLALYQKNFSDFRDYKTWVFLPAREKKSPPNLRFHFPFIQLGTMGYYRVGYYSEKMSGLLALSSPFSILV